MKFARFMDKEMTQFKEGKLYSGSGEKVVSRKQAIAIAYSQARKKRLLR